MHPDRMWHSPRGQVLTPCPVLPGPQCSQAPNSNYGAASWDGRNMCEEQEPLSSPDSEDTRCVLLSKPRPCLGLRSRLCRMGASTTSASVKCWTELGMASSFSLSFLSIFFFLFFLIPNSTHFHETSNSTEVDNVLIETQLLLRITASSLLIFFV